MRQQEKVTAEAKKAETITEKIPFTAGILAGGKSSRMGENKAFLSWQNTTFLGHILEQTQEFAQVLISVAEDFPCADIMVSGAENSPAADVTVSEAGRHPQLVRDEREGYGPLEGLYQLLRHAEYPWVFAVAADMPLLNRDVIERLLEVAREDIQAVIIREQTKGRVHPLCGLYHVSCIPMIEQLFLKERRSMQSLLKCIRVQYVSPEELEIGVRVLMNVNHPWEYQALLSEETAEAAEKENENEGKEK